MFSYWAYILVGNDKTGKSTLQKLVIDLLCKKSVKAKDENRDFDIVHPEMIKYARTIFIMNKSIQEQKTVSSVEKLFGRDNISRKTRPFKAHDICILSSHSDGACIVQIDLMIKFLRREGYNVAGVFFENTFDDDVSNISNLNWDERLWFENPHINMAPAVNAQLKAKSHEFVDFLIKRTRGFPTATAST